MGAWMLWSQLLYMESQLSYSHCGPSAWPWLLQSTFILQGVVECYVEKAVTV